MAGTEKGAPAGTLKVDPLMLQEAIARRDQAAAVRRWWQDKATTQPAGLTGLALSGGGIRSATFSLGILQALAKSKSDAFGKIDIVSSVSGGGYIACFLRSLFMPKRGRGIVPDASVEHPQFTDDEIADQYAFARRVLGSGTHERDIHWPEPKSKEDKTGKGPPRRNPLWWLREHSRYLAPNGPTDYGFAVAQIARNWLAMVYIFLLAALACFSVLVALEVLVRWWSPIAFAWTWRALGTSDSIELACGRCVAGNALFLPVSPLLIAAALPAFTSLVLAMAYWMTEAMSPNERDVERQKRNLRLVCGSAVLALLLVVLASELLVRWAQRQAEKARAPLPQPDPHILWMIGAGVLLTALGALVAMIVAARLKTKGSELTIELRRWATKWLANSNQAFFIIIVIAAIDTMGAGLAAWLTAPGGRAVSGTVALLSPAFAYLIKKLPDWFGGPGKSSIFALLERFLGAVSLIAGLLLYGMLAIAAAAMLHSAAWSGEAWASAPQKLQFILFVLVIWALALIAGRSNGFINLSSLHAFYTSRLTRAYLGASNTSRLLKAAEPGPESGITDSDSADYIQAELYSHADLPAPVHIINTTINETIDPKSALVARDRKGDVLSVEPGGIQVGTELIDWSKVGDPNEAEQISLGEWCAISGAAASSGMGRLTNLGFALAFTFANIRLGYWWWSPGVCAKSKKALKGPMRSFAKRFGTYVYLANEMTARYSRGYARKYLTDGGHFENTGAYRLHERRVPKIIVCDNGADPKYAFEDLENLTRKVRLDLGGDMKVLRGEELEDAISDLGAINKSVFVPVGVNGEWKGAFADPAGTAFALLLKASFDDGDVRLIWVKPRLLAGLPPDVEGYASSNPPFPQQPTGDQFFDEAQWESYRKLGEISMERLLEACPRLLEMSPS